MEKNSVEILKEEEEEKGEIIDWDVTDWEKVADVNRVQYHLPPFSSNAVGREKEESTSQAN